MKQLLASLTLTLIAIVTTGCSSSNGAAPGDVLLFSTDYGLGLINGATNGPDSHAADVDDAYAVTLALDGNLDIQGIVTLFGNDKAKPSHESAYRGLSALGYTKDILALGAQGFLDAEAVQFDPPGEELPPFCINDGVQLMKDVLDRNASDTVTLFALGPFTDIACLLRAYPDSFNKLKQIIGLVGSGDGKPVLQGIDVVDFNFAMDPTALGLVIQQEQVPFVAIMFEVSQFGTLTNDVIETWASSGTPEQQYYGQATQQHAAYWDAIFTETDGQALFDAHTVYYFLNPQLYDCADHRVATAIVGGYPDTSASTTKNFFTVTASPVTPPEGATVYTGSVRGCSGFVDADSVDSLEETVQASIRRY
ncbi:Pyrimidine-specific ribonucleoside hydrolase RihA [Halioglobus japonicus]|nr:Pyrimidine-specific ribonucleoside hydrolase RihA [Halioglobus japonicus]